VIESNYLIYQINQYDTIYVTPMARETHLSDFLHYLAAAELDDEAERLPSLAALSKSLGMSVAGLREQLEVAKALGLVEVRPRTGIRRLPYNFFPTVQTSLAYALETDPGYFTAFADLRNQLEAAYWDQAVCKLTPQDHHELQALMAKAWDKLRGEPVQIPFDEHRRLHLCIFRRLENPFVLGLLDAYWDAYQAVGLSLYADYGYLHQVWTYHQKMVDAICAGDFAEGFQMLVQHKDLLYHHPLPAVKGRGKGKNVQEPTV
jgi:DNA-binding FadR family transcriptional regulator